MIRKNQLFVSVLFFLLLSFVHGTGESEPAEENGDFTFTYFKATAAAPGDPELSTDTRIGQILYEETGTIVKFDYLVGDLDTRIGIDLASGDMADVVMGAGGSTPKWVDGGALIPLEKLLPDEAPTLWEMGGDFWKRYYSKDGHLYYISSFFPQGGSAPKINIPGSFQIQIDALRKSGYPELKTIEGMFDWMRTYLSENPLNDKGEENIGFLTLIDGWRRPLNWSIPYAPEMAAKITSAGVEYTIPETLDIFKEAFRVYNKAWNDGLIDKESFVINHEQYVAKIATGRYIAHWAAPWFFQDATTSLKKEGREDRTYWMMPLQAADDIPLPKPTQVVPNTEGYGITKAADNPLRIVQFLEHLSQLEQQKLVFWGVEGEDWYKDSDGRMKMTAQQAANYKDEEYRKKQGLGLFLYGWPTGEGLLPDGNSWNPDNQPEVAEMAFTDLQKELLDAYNLQVPADQLPSETVSRKWEPVWSIQLEQGSEAQIAGSKLDSIRDKHIPIMIMSAPEDFDAAWNAYIKEMESIGVDKYIEAIEAGIQERLDTY